MFDRHGRLVESIMSEETSQITIDGNTAQFTVPAGRVLRFRVSIDAGTRLSQRLLLSGRTSAGQTVLQWSSGEKFAPDGGSWNYWIPANATSYGVTASGFCKVFKDDWRENSTDRDHTQVTPAGGFVYYDDVGDRAQGHDWNFRDLKLDFTFENPRGDDEVATEGAELPVHEAAPALA
jgi:hypothetical protein